MSFLNFNKNSSDYNDKNKENITIKILGSNCKKCILLEEETKKAVNSMGLNVTIKHIIDYAEISTYGVMNTPALVVNDEVVSMGYVLKKKEIIKLLNKLQMQ